VLRQVGDLERILARLALRTARPRDLARMRHAFQQFAKLGKFAHGFAQLLHWRAVDLSQLSAQFRQLLER
ncbi:hypothetical protein, partial [Enterobacter hormaechei]|uniref:hypothetical protein n=1 Tax=Enterobacter hormaechei TaxID=158836 RepID=UPI001F49A699